MHKLLEISKEQGCLSCRFAQNFFDFVIVISLIGCNKPCYNSGQGTYTKYSINSSLRYSAKYGFAIDDPKNELDDTQLDDTITNVLNCVKDLGSLSDAEKIQNECNGDWDPNIKSCLTVKVPDNWYVSSCSGEEIFPCTVPFASCAAKGLVYNPACPCSCRTIIQNDDIIVTAPNLKVFPGQLTTLLTGCTNAWIGRLEKCASTDNITQMESQ